MQLTSFSVENYRAFARRQDIDLRPLTLFFGWNSGGKSALVRFLPLLSESIRGITPPICLAGEVGRQATWAELVCKSTKRDLLRFALHWQQTPLRAEWKIRGELGGGWQAIQSLEMRTGAISAKFISTEKEEEEWHSLIPSIATDSDTQQPFQTLKNGLNQIASQVQWISGVRARPSRIVLSSGTARPILSSDGHDAVEHLIQAQLRSTENPLLEETRRFFQALGEHLSLDNPITGGWRVLLSPRQSLQVAVNLCDTGEGYAQVLPVLVALAAARLGGPRLLCLEQPELHLHTRAQTVLADLLVASATAASKPTILLETHSEILLMSVQLAIAEGKIAPGMVRVYWVESRPDGTSDATPIDFDSHGQPTATALMGAFDEAVQLGRKLMAIQLKEEPSCG